MSTIQTVCVGYGFAGRLIHSYLVKLVPQLTLRGIASRNPATREKIVAEQGCRAYASFEEVLYDPQVDLVILATPHDVHCQQAIAALKAGKHVVTDKVMCLNLDECDQMISAARQSGKLLSVFHNRRCDGDYLTLKRAMADGTVGQVRWLELAWGRFGPPRGWRGQKAHGGGRIYDLGAHMLDQILQLFPQPIASVDARLHYDFPSADVESHALVMLRFEDGSTALCDASSFDHLPKPRFLARGDKATFVKHGVDPQEAAMIAGNIDAAVEPPENYARLADGQKQWTVPTLPGRWRDYYENIVDVLLHDKTPLVQLEEMRRLMAVYDAIFQSVRTHQPVTPEVR